MSNLSIEFDFSGAAALGCLGEVRDTHWNLCLAEDGTTCAFAQNRSSPYGARLEPDEDAAVVTQNITVFDAPWQVYVWVGEVDGGTLEHEEGYLPTVRVYDVSNLVVNDTNSSTVAAAASRILLVSTNECIVSDFSHRCAVDTAPPPLGGKDRRLKAPPSGAGGGESGEGGENGASQDGASQGGASQGGTSQGGGGSESSDDNGLGSDGAGGTTSSRAPVGSGTGAGGDPSPVAAPDGGSLGGGQA